MKAILISIQPQWVAKILSGEKTIEVRKTFPRHYEPIEVYIYCTKGDSKSPNTWDAPIFKAGVKYSEKYSENAILRKLPVSSGFLPRQKVVAKFTLKTVDYLGWGGLCVKEDAEKELQGTCLTKQDIIEYAGKKLPIIEIDGRALKDMTRLSCYKWHIENLVIFDNPMELSEFYTTCPDAYLGGDGWGGEDWYCQDGYSKHSVKDPENKGSISWDECIYFDNPRVGGESCENQDYAYCMCSGKKPVTKPPQSWQYVEVASDN